MKSVLLIFVAVLLTGLIPGSVFAQVPVPYPSDMDDESGKALPRPAKEAADEYLAVLEQLHDLINDYAVYISEVSPQTRASLSHSMQLIAKRLARGKYTEEYQALIRDLANYSQALDSEDMKVIEEQSLQAKKVHKLIRSLRREIEVINRLLEADVAERLADCQQFDKQIDEYLSLKLENLMLAPGTVTIVVDDDGDTSYVVSSEGVTIEAPNIIIPPTPPGAPAPPAPPSPAPRLDDIIYFPDRGTTKGLERSYSAVLTATNRRLPIYIDLPAGDIRIVGTNAEVITATLEIELAAENRASEKSFLKSTQLAVSSEANGYYIKTRFPSLSDPETRLLNSRLKIDVPRNNAIDCKASFGAVQIKDLGNDVTVNGNHANATLSDISGNVYIKNSMGPIKVERIRGAVEAYNSYNAISVENCSGVMTLENSYGSISVRDSEGEVTLRNSGPITIRDHVGEVMIDNSNGLVEVSRVRGNVAAYNAYQPLVVQNITGNAKLENANARVTANTISGKLRVSNSFGDIWITNPTGPFRLINENGAIELFLTGRSDGPSSVTNSYGSISVHLASTLDLILEAETLDGNINSTLPITLADHGDRKTGQLKMGNASTRLDITGTNSTIMIDGTK